MTLARSSVNVASAVTADELDLDAKPNTLASLKLMMSLVFDCWEGVGEGVSFYFSDFQATPRVTHAPRPGLRPSTAKPLPNPYRLATKEG